VRSKEGEGAEFVITLPLDQSQPAAEPAAAMNGKSI
jgi:hypothetical protein